MKISQIAESAISDVTSLLCLIAAFKVAHHYEAGIIAFGILTLAAGLFGVGVSIAIGKAAKYHRNKSFVTKHETR